MSTLRNSKALRSNLNELAVKQTETRLKMDLKELAKETEYYISDLNEAYGNFFGELLKEITLYQEYSKSEIAEQNKEGREAEAKYGAQKTPPRILANGGFWPGLSSGWLAQKDRAAKLVRDDPGGFYQGITAFRRRVIEGENLRKLTQNPRAKLGNTKKDTGVLRKGGGKRAKSTAQTPFSKFLGSHKNDILYVNKIFGKIEAEYELSSGRKALKTKVLNAAIAEIRFPNHVKPPKSYQMKVSVSAFGGVMPGGKLQNEWNTVDLILKQKDASNEHQWVKINGQRGHMRALITPMIRWFMAKEFKKQTQDFFKAIK